MLGAALEAWRRMLSRVDPAQHLWVAKVWALTLAPGVFFAWVVMACEQPAVWPGEWFMNAGIYLNSDHLGTLAMVWSAMVMVRVTLVPGSTGRDVLRAAAALLALTVAWLAYFLYIYIFLPETSAMGRAVLLGVGCLEICLTVLLLGHFVVPGPMSRLVRGEDSDWEWLDVLRYAPDRVMVTIAPTGEWNIVPLEKTRKGRR